MSLKGKNRNLFSYNNADRKNSHFMYKDFEKTKSYHTDFSKAAFTGTSLRAAQLKYCSFSGAIFSDVDFVGTNLRGSSFKGATFVRCLFQGVVLDKTSFLDAKFKDCYFVGTNFNKARKKPDNTNGIEFIPSAPLQEAISPDLRDIVEELRKNDIIRRSSVLHCKNGRINTVSIYILKKDYTEEQLIALFPLLPDFVSTQFYTLSYVRQLLKKAERIDKI